MANPVALLRRGIETVISRTRSLWRGMRGGAAVDAEIREEFGAHIEMRAADLERQGRSPSAALLEARREFGTVATHREASRESRGLHRVDAFRFSAIDIKLGVRMMIKYPGLTLIAGLGMAVAIAIGTGYASVVHALLGASLPLPGGERVVALQNWDFGSGRRGTTSESDFVAWRDQLRTVQDVGAYRTILRNLFAADGSAEPLAIAEMSASGFRVAGVQPVRGRYLLDADEARGAQPVVVLGYDVWTERFASDPAIAGRQLRLGASVYTVVGVMPKGFAFPINHHIWIALTVDPSVIRRASGPALSAFGRLAPGVNIAQARAEMDGIGRRVAAAHPDTHEHLRAQVQPYTRPVGGMDDPGDVRGALMLPLLTTLLLIVICVNVAVLIYARTAIRHGEIVVRTALGASRRRVVAQLFAEALVLSSVAAIVGLLITGFALHEANLVLASVFGGQLPFWMDFRLSLSSVVYAGGLAVLAAVITGVLPALKATGSRLQTSLQQLSAGGGSIRLGRAWTALIVGQIAVTVALLPVAVFQANAMFHYGTVDSGFADSAYAVSVVDMEPERTGSFEVRYADRIGELTRTLRGEPGVAGVTVSSNIPGKERYARLEIQRDGSSDTATSESVARFATVDASYFDAFGIRPIAGRGFTPADADTAAMSIVVNQTFAKHYFAGGDVIGRRIRQWPAREGNERVAERSARRWYEIVGVVPDFPNAMIPESDEEKVYQAASPAVMYPATIAVRLRGVPMTGIAGQLRATAARVDPALQLKNVRMLSAVYDDDQWALRLTGLGIAIVTASVLLLSAAGIYSMMSLAVTRRRREIGIRAALGASSRHILGSVFARASAQLGIGVAAGLGTIVVIDRLTLHGALVRNAMLVGEVAAIIVVVGLLASIGPARRGLRIQPAESLKQE